MNDSTSGVPARREDDRSPFDAIRRLDESGRETWSARALQDVMAYARWENFEVPLNRAMRAAENVGADVTSNFLRSQKISVTRPGVDYDLTRYAAYLVAMNGDPNKPEVARAQTYFAVKTREAEVGAQAPAFAVPKTMSEALRLAADQADRADAEHAGRVAAEQERDQLAPAAESWDLLANASGDYDLQAAAQMLCRDPDIEIGRVRLAKLLRRLGWIDGNKMRPYQQQVNAGRLVAKMRTWVDPDTDERHVTYQARITPKGLHALRGHLTGVKPLQLRFESIDGMDEDGAA